MLIVLNGLRLAARKHAFRSGAIAKLIDLRLSVNRLCPVRRLVWNFLKHVLGRCNLAVTVHRNGFLEMKDRRRWIIWIVLTRLVALAV